MFVLNQETPSDHVKREDDGFGLQVWHSEGITCPRGTIPIRRFDKNISHTKYDPLVPNAADRATKGHKASLIFSFCLNKTSNNVTNLCMCTK